MVESLEPSYRSSIPSSPKVLKWYYFLFSYWYVHILLHIYVYVSLRVDEMKRSSSTLFRNPTPKVLRINWNGTTFQIIFLPVSPSICRVCERQIRSCRNPQRLANFVLLLCNTGSVETTTSRQTEASISRLARTTHESDVCVFSGNCLLLTNVYLSSCEGDFGTFESDGLYPNFVRSTAVSCIAYVPVRICYVRDVIVLSYAHCVPVAISMR